MTNSKPDRMGNFEFTVRTIPELFPEMTTAQLQKWHGILRTTQLKLEEELKSTALHTCRICFLEEWGYRDDLPVSWYKKGEAEICFSHDYETAETLLRDAGYTEDAEEIPEQAPVTVEGLTVHMDKNLPPPATETERTLEELMDIL